MNNVKKFFNTKIWIIIACIVIFILANSSQESYVSLDDVESTSLQSTDQTTSSSTSPSSSTSTPTAPTVPSSGPEIPEKPVEFNKEPLISPQIIPVIIGVILLVLAVALTLRKRTEDRRMISSSSVVKKTIIDSRRDKFQTHIKTLIDILSEFLQKGSYAEGIIYGYHKLDQNMRKMIGKKRENFLTPKEFILSLDLPEIIEHIDVIISLFYSARYQLAEMKHEDLILFIEKLLTMQALSKSRYEIQIYEKSLKDS